MRKIFIGALSSQIIKGLLPLILIPLFVSEWGDDIYSIWLKSLALVIFVSFFGTGLNTYGINRCQISFSKDFVGSFKIYDTLLSLNIFMFLFASFVQVSVLLILHFFFGLTDLWLAIILGFYIAINNLYSYVNLIYRVKNKYHFSLYFSIIFTLILYGGMALILTNEYGPLHLASWMLIFTIFATLFQLFLIKLLLNLKLNIAFSLMRFLPYILRSYKFLFFQVGDYFRINLPLVFLGYMASPILVVVFSINRTLSNITSQFYILIHHTIMQKVTDTYAKTPGNEEKSTYLITGYTTFSILIYICFFLLVSYENILKLWIGDSYLSYFDYELFILLLINSLLYCSWNIGTVFLVATNNFSKLSYLSALHGMAFFAFLVCGYFISGLKMMLLFGILSEIIFGMFIINREIFKYLRLRLKDYASLYFFSMFQILVYSFIYFFSESMIFSISLYSIFLALLTLISWKNRNLVLSHLMKGT